MKKFLLLLLTLLPLPALAANVLFIATDNVPPGKFRVLADAARPYGIRVDVRYLQKLPVDVDEGVFHGHDAVLFDSYLQDEVRARLARALPALKAPQLWLYDAKPFWSGFPETIAKRLITYYTNGGRANFDAFFRTLAAQLAGHGFAGIPDPIVFPKTAIYHPGAPGQVFADPASYLRWKGIDPERRRPVIAIFLHQQYIASEQTAFIDDLIARIEASEAIPLAIYTPATENGGFSAMTTVGGKVIADAAINTQIMLNAEGRRAEFTALGIPVVQATPYRRGGEAVWAADPHGVALMDVPFYLAQSEYAGIADIQIAAAVRKEDEQIVSIGAQAAAVVTKALNLARLRHLPKAEKKVAVFFWNYPPGEKNLSASFMNVPRSLETMLSALKAADYSTGTPSEPEVIGKLQQLLAPFYRSDRFDALLQSDLAELFPVKAYEKWLGMLPAPVRSELMGKFGPPEKSAMVVRRNGEAYFVIPRHKIGNLVILPQPPRGERQENKEKALYHATHAPPSHFYLAVYLWARENFRTDAIIHFGTHGTQEWLPGKERGLSVHDYPMLAVGNVPVVYPYIADNIGEAQQAKRRGRAVTVSHQPPPFRPAGLHSVLIQMHDLLHAWLAQDEGAVKAKIKADLIALTAKERIGLDMGWSAGRIDAGFPAFVDELHAHLHELAAMAQPLGLHTLGRAPAETHRLATVLLMLGRPFWEGAAAHAGAKPEDFDEALVTDYEHLPETTPYQLLRAHLDGQDVTAATLPATLREPMDKARKWYADIGADNEIPALLAALDGKHLSTSYGGDPIKNPDAYPTGRNLYGFDPSRVPTKQAWEAGKEAADKLLAEHSRQKGVLPKKLTFSLWSVETMRHQGILEAQALWLMGVEPVWDAGGRVTDVKLVPREQLGRPRIDVVLSATGLYRDHFPNPMKQLAKAAVLAAEADGPGEEDNPVAANSRRIAAELAKQGAAPAAARRAGQTRIFSSETGRYGTGLDDATLASDTWKSKAEGDRKLAQLYLARMQYAYGPDETDWGKDGADLGRGRSLNLYAEHLKGTEGAVLSRTSNLYGMLTTDDPFQYLGGIALAVRSLDGKAPELYISNLRGAGSGKVEGAAQFLAKELTTRNFHPGYIKGLMQEGYAGTLQVLDGMNNFWGWTAVSREIVRNDQWQAFVDVYVKDKHRLGLRQWFEHHNPHALAQSIERMLEAARQKYWDADPKVVAELKDRYRDLAHRFDVKSDNAAFMKFIGPTGYGLSGAVPPLSAASHSPSSRPQSVADNIATPPPVPPIRGLQLDKIRSSAAPAPFAASALLILLLAVLAGGWRQSRGMSRFPLSLKRNSP